MLWKRASALTNAHSVRTASRTSCAMYARTAAAVLSRGRSGLPRNGVLDCRLRSARRRTSGCICPTAWTISPRIRRSFAIFRRSSVEAGGIGSALPLPWGEGWGEGVRSIVRAHPLTRRCAPTSPYGRGENALVTRRFRLEMMPAHVTIADELTRAVMAGLVPAIHVLLLLLRQTDVDARHKAGHDERRADRRERRHEHPGQQQVS